MSTAAGEHQGLGVSHYAWSSSPLRRYVDLVNQWQLLALLNNEAAPFARNSASLLGAIREFEVAYAAYGEFQEKMEYYWCLRWLVQEGVTQSEATVVREGVVKLRQIPLYVRVSSLPDLPSGTAVIVQIESVDLVDSSLHVVYKQRVNQP
jgi:exoribonuclease-2